MSKEAVKKIPGLGMRSLKTAVSVALCFVFFAILHRLVDFSFFNQSDSIPFYACAAAIICMQNTVEGSVTSGLFRLFGNAVGGALGILALFVLPYVSWPVQIIIIFFGILTCMVACNITKKQRSCAMACVVFIAVISVMGDRDPLIYALYRIFETVIGVVIAIGVNKFLIIPGFMYKLRDKIIKNKSAKEKDIEETEDADADIEHHWVHTVDVVYTANAYGSEDNVGRTDITNDEIIGSENEMSVQLGEIDGEPEDEPK